MDLEENLLNELISPDPEAPSVVVFGKARGRMDEVIRLLCKIGTVSAYGTFSEVGVLELIAAVPCLRVVLLGGAIEDEARDRIRDVLEQNHPGVQTSEPGRHYPYSDGNIVADVRAKLGKPFE